MNAFGDKLNGGDDIASAGRTTVQEMRPDAIGCYIASGLNLFKR